MGSIPFTYYLVAGLGIGYLILLGVTLRNRLQLGTLQPWLIATLLTALLAQAIHIFVPTASVGPYAWLFIGGITQPAVAVFLTSLALVTFTALSIRYLQRGGGLVLLIIGIAWWIGLVFVSYQIPDARSLGQPGWLNTAFVPPINVAGALALGGWLVMVILTLIFTVYSFYRAHLPEIANRVLFWVLIFPLVFMGAVLGASGTDFLKEMGWIAQFIGLVGVVYAALAHRVLDIRRVLRSAITSTLLTIITAIIVFVALLVARNIASQVANISLVLAVLAVAVAILYAPVRGFAVSILDRIFGSSSEDAATIVRRYSQGVSGVVELSELSDVAIDTLRQTLRVRRGGLLLATRDDKDTIRVEPMMSSKSDMPAQLRGWIPKDGPIYKTLFSQRMPLTQYDLEYSRDYVDVPPEMKSFFKQLRMSVYAPVVAQGQLIGILACAAKANDNPFYAQDLELLATIANQTGVSLRNARLVDDLRKASDELHGLNKDITETKERLEQLDSVKTDFITIASHELRTPLAQIRGYTDIMDALNDQGMIDPDQMSGMTNNLRKATIRLEELITAMLDVSTIGLDAMDLRFAQTTIDSVLRLSIEPLSDSIKQRKLQLAARGLKGLPPIEADMQRLVQAFRNIILNAIKYTPDGGRIDISATLHHNDTTKSDEIVIEIADTGIGIDPKNHEVIFEKFFRLFDPGLHSTGATKFMGAGPGLGLTIARGVIQGHGGKIWVKSSGYDPEKLPGTTVYVMLPVSPPEGSKRVLPIGVPETPAPSIAMPVGSIATKQ